MVRLHDPSTAGTHPGLPVEEKALHYLGSLSLAALTSRCNHIPTLFNASRGLGSSQLNVSSLQDEECSTRFTAKKSATGSNIYLLRLP